MSLEALLNRHDIWRANRTSHDSSRHLPTGHEQLDRQLPGGGWPIGALSEILLEHGGIGELRLVMPALARLNRDNRWIAWVNPPHIPYAPAMIAAGLDLERMLWIRPGQDRDSLWALEQALRSGVCGAVLGWPEAPGIAALRRLQLAAEEGGALGLLFRSLQDARQSSPAALRLQLEPGPSAATVRIMKCRGGWGGSTAALNVA